MNLYTYDDILFFLPANHRFPLEKYARLRKFVQAQPWLPPACLLKPQPVESAQLLLAHSKHYVQKVFSGSLSATEIRRLGLPWSPELVDRCRHSVGATIAASADALKYGVGISLGGGTHHACRNEGQGFCVFNDIVVAARVRQKTGEINRVLVIDCDVHQGNGTAEITQNDATIFTLSLHGEKNFPFRKIPSDIDIGLPDKTGDQAYLTALQKGLQRAVNLSRPQLIFYLAGADVHEADKLGRLRLTTAGIAARDRLVFDTSLAASAPLVLTMAGGYGRNIDNTVKIQAETIRLALQMLPRS